MNNKNKNLDLLIKEINKQITGCNWEKQIEWGLKKISKEIHENPKKGLTFGDKERATKQ